MRLDKYLKVSRLIKRRTLAQEACDNSKVKLNSKIAKPSADVKEGDIIEITFGERVIKVEVLKVLEHTLKQDAADLYRVISWKDDAIRIDFLNNAVLKMHIALFF